MNTQRGFASAGILIAIVLGLVVLGGGTYFFMQQTPSPTLSENNLSETTTVPAQPVQNKPTTPTPVPNEPTNETELWVITTKFDTVFVQNAEANRAAYESSYAKVVSVYVPIPSSVKVHDSKVSSTDQNTFFVTAKDQIGGEAAYVLNIEKKTFTKLFSSADHSDFKLASIGNVSPDDTAIRFNFAACDGCDGGIIGGAVYNIPRNSYKNIGATPLFRWTANGGFEYKVAPAGCEAYFQNPFRDTQGMPCDDKLAAASWIQGTW